MGVRVRGHIGPVGASADAGKGCMAIFMVALFALLVAGPYLLGQWAAKHLGGGITAQHITGWVLEGPWLGFLALLGVGYVISLFRK
jgi:hypothetical protein